MFIRFSTEKVLDLCKICPPPPAPHVFVKCSRFETLWTRKNGFRERVSCLQKVHFPEKLCEINKKYQKVKLFILKKSTNFVLNIFWLNARAFILIEKTLLKIKNRGFRPNNARYKKC